MLVQTLRCLLQLFELMLVTMTLYYGGHLVVNDLMSGGDLVSFILYQIELGSALEVNAHISVVKHVKIESY